MTVTRVFSATSFILAAMLLGFMVGGFAGGRLVSVSEGEMGWDRLADALGGAAIGVLVGLGAGSWGARRVTHRRRWMWAGIFTAASLAVFAYMQANPIRP